MDQAASRGQVRRTGGRWAAAHAGPAVTGSLQALRSWVVEAALPTWATLGFDEQAGRFRERLDRTGRPLDVPHRSMVQARQIYVFAHACHLGWWDDGGRLAERAMASLLRDFGDVSGREASFAFSVDAGGRTVSAVRDAYGHAFVLFAIAWLHRVTGDPALLRLAARTNAFVTAHLVDPAHGGLFDTHPVASREKRQNPVMHLLEAYLALERTAPGQGYLDDARTLVALFRSRLVDDASGALVEHFAEDWAPSPDPARAGVVEPGHLFEWCWLLGEYERLSGETLRPWRDRLYDLARAHGVGPGGLLHAELTTAFAARSRSHRVWPHTEAIKAAVDRHADGDASALPFAASMAGALLEHFVGRPFPGGWVDEVDAHGAPLVDHVPASSLYHLVFAASEASRSVVEGQAARADRQPLVLR